MRHLIHALLPLLLAASAAAQQPSPTTRFAERIVGEWAGTGTVYGQSVRLTRSWSHDLADTFLRADMGVEMGNGRSFRVLAYWQKERDGQFRVIWMDETGRLQDYDALVDTEGSEAVVVYLNEDPVDGEPTDWRRLTFRIVDGDRYEERIESQTPDGWKEVGAFDFTRSAP